MVSEKVFWGQHSPHPVVGVLSYKAYRSEDVTAFRLVIPTTSYEVNKVTHHDYNFSDVPLACDGGHQIQAHQLILAPVSPNFWNNRTLIKSRYASHKCSRATAPV